MNVLYESQVLLSRIFDLWVEALWQLKIFKMADAKRGRFVIRRFSFLVESMKLHILGF